ncbi:hypothetical protein VCV18_012323 [Metarhizium anisopliae]
MAKKEVSGLVQIPEPGFADHEVDTRPQHSDGSPFASDTFSLYFQNEGPLHIHQSFLNSSTKLASKCRPTTVFGSPPRTIRFDDVTLDTGHVLIHFLVTGQYNGLKPKGESMNERHASEFATALHVAAVAESYGLSALHDLATNEIQKLGDKLTMFSVIHIVEEASPTSIRIPEVAAYIRSRIRDFCDISTRTAGEAALSVFGTPNTIAKLVLKSVVERNLQELPVEEPTPQGVDGEGTAPATKCGESIPMEKQEPEPELEHRDQAIR